MPVCVPFLARLAEPSSGGVAEPVSAHPRVSQETPKESASDSHTQPFVLRFATPPFRLEHRLPPGTTITEVNRETTDDR